MFNQFFFIFRLILVTKPPSSEIFSTSVVSNARQSVVSLPFLKLKWVLDNILNLSAHIPKYTKTKPNFNKQKIYQDIPKYTKTKQHFNKQKIYQDIPK
jgi:hypothetical protein